MAEGDWPDVEGGLVTYLKAELTTTNRVFLGVPDGAVGSPAMFPLCTVQRIGGGQDPSEASIDLALVQINVIGRERDKIGCWNVTAEVRKVLAAIRGATLLAAGVVAYGAEVNNCSYAPDPADGQRPRYVITTQVVTRAA